MLLIIHVDKKNTNGTIFLMMLGSRWHIAGTLIYTLSHEGD